MPVGFGSPVVSVVIVVLQFLIDGDPLVNAVDLLCSSWDAVNVSVGSRKWTLLLAGSGVGGTCPCVSFGSGVGLDDWLDDLKDFWP